MKDHPRFTHLTLLARARTALASHAEASADIAEVIADLDTAILSIDRLSRHNRAWPRNHQCRRGQLWRAAGAGSDLLPLTMGRNQR